MSLLRPCPGVAGCYLYTIRKGETLTSIAGFFGVGADAILKLNPAIVDPDRIIAGQVIKLPPPTR